METGILITAIAIMVLGIFHIAFTPKFHSSLTTNALWFISGGLALINLAFLNIILVSIQEKESIVLIFCQIANFFLVIFMGFLLKVRSAPQIIVGFLLALTEFILVIGL